MINKAIIVGNLGADPDLRTTNNGTSVCSMSVATTFKTKDKEQTEWHSIVVFGKVAESCGQYLSKGRQVYIEGRIQTRKWQDKEGRDRYSTEIVAYEVKFLGSRGDAPTTTQPAVASDIPF